MKHFLGLDADDKLVFTHTHKTYKTGLGGWPVEFDLDNPDSTNPGVIGFKQNMKTKTIVKWVGYDCPCSPSVGVCSCASKRRVDHCCVDGALVAKPVAGLLVDGSPHTPGVIVDRPPGTPIEIKIASADTPDDGTVLVMQEDVIRLLETLDYSVELTFTGGETNPATLYAPAQGVVGRVTAYGEHTCPLELRVRGWA